jgi:hypothetical protein
MGIDLADYLVANDLAIRQSMRGRAIRCPLYR